jgi:hypothetical protein
MPLWLAHRERPACQAALEQRAEQPARLLAPARLAGQLQEAMWPQPVDGLAVPGFELLVCEIWYCTEDFIHFTN